MLKVHAANSPHLSGARMIDLDDAPFSKYFSQILFTKQPSKRPAMITNLGSLSHHHTLYWRGNQFQETNRD